MIIPSSVYRLVDRTAISDTNPWPNLCTEREKDVAETSTEALVNEESIP